MLLDMTQLSHENGFLRGKKKYLKALFLCREREKKPWMLPSGYLQANFIFYSIYFWTNVCLFLTSVELLCYDMSLELTSLLCSSKGWSARLKYSDWILAWLLGY